MRKTGIDSVLRRYGLDFWRPGSRAYYAQRYLRGEGIEIGALGNPTFVPEGVKVTYIDRLSYDELIAIYPEVESSAIVRPTLVEDGFVLASISDHSQDFVIAHHVLEHSPNPVQVLFNWGRILRNKGILLISVPIVDLCFDKGREVTSLKHLLDDFELCRNGNVQRFHDKNRQHFEEWLRFSDPAIRKERGMEALKLTEAAFTQQVNQLIKQYDNGEVDIHFHTFSVASFKDMLNHFCAHLDRRFSVCVCTRYKMEIIAALEKTM